MGIFSSNDTTNAFVERWRYDTNDTLLAGPMLYDVNKNGRRDIVFGTKDGRVILLDEHANVRWIYNVNDDAGEVESYFEDPESPNSINSAPAIGDIDEDGMNEVVFGTENGKLYALDHTGAVQWEYETEGNIRATPLLQDINQDTLLETIVGCTAGYLYVIGARGELKQKINVGTGIEATPAVLNDNYVIGCHDGTIRCLDGEEERWRYTTQDTIVAPITVHELYNNDSPVILAGSTDFTMYALDKHGEECFTYQTDGAIVARPTVADINDDGENEIVFGSCDNNVYAITNNGDTIWTYETYFWVAAPPVVADIDGDGNNEVIVGSYDHSLYILSSKGEYSLNYVPGLGGVVNQSGHHSETMTKQPGSIHAKKLWKYQTPGHVVGCAYDNQRESIIVNVKEGSVEALGPEEK